MAPLPAGRGLLLAAWLVTGPLGHLAGGLADLLVLAGRIAWARARGRRLW